MTSSLIFFWTDQIFSSEIKAMRVFFDFFFKEWTWDHNAFPMNTHRDLAMTFHYSSYIISKIFLSKSFSSSFFFPFEINYEIHEIQILTWIIYKFVRILYKMIIIKMNYFIFKASHEVKKSFKNMRRYILIFDMTILYNFVNHSIQINI